MNNASWETQRELAEMLVGGVSVHTTLDEKGKKEATVTVHYLFSDRSSYCVSDHLWGGLQSHLHDIPIGVRIRVV